MPRNRCSASSEQVFAINRNQCSASIGMAVRLSSESAAFWEDRYHATAVESGEHPMRCVSYIDLSMVRAGVVQHPSEWATCGYREIQKPPQRFRIIDREALAEALDIPLSDLGERHRDWTEAALAAAEHKGQPQWSHSVAVGSRDFVRRIEAELGARAAGRTIEAFDGAFGVSTLQDPLAPYGHRFAPENSAARLKSGAFR